VEVNRLNKPKMLPKLKR